ncbi:MAG TPA: ABC transporter substrate-binding protein [Lentisphaeria bacterium]|nr:MAG: hypothetical protein A2X47_04780 [Lentisphaerae bacterium GWF2_38_69]HBM16307.1 ABC transporter substrate-binding protein [Lentisphaeria bacterium]
MISFLFRKLCILILFCITFVNVNGAQIAVCSAENFYGSIAKSIGGKYVSVTSIISNPDADPHLFSTSPKTAMALAKANVVIYNGVDYDPWINSMLSVLDTKTRKDMIVIEVSDLVKINEDENPHIWYNPETFPVLALKLSEVFSKIIPDKKDYFEDNLESFQNNYKQVYKLIDAIKRNFAGTEVTATEPVFDYMAGMLGFNIKGKDYQWIIMNGSDPSPKITASFINLLKSKSVKILFYNNQVISSSTRNMLDIAKSRGIEVVGVSETMPLDTDATQWLIKTLESVKTALTATNKKQNQ